MNWGLSNFATMEEQSMRREGHHIFCLTFVQLKLLSHSFLNFYWKWEKGHFSNSRFHVFGKKIKQIWIQWYYSLGKIMNYEYAKFQANPLTLDTQSACSKRLCFGEIQYREKLQMIFPACAQAAVWLSDMRTIRQLGGGLDSLSVALIMRRCWL